jgi:hypothetical protein
VNDGLVKTYTLQNLMQMILAQRYRKVGDQIGQKKLGGRRTTSKDGGAQRRGWCARDARALVVELEDVQLLVRACVCETGPGHPCIHSRRACYHGCIDHMLVGYRRISSETGEQVSDKARCVYERLCDVCMKYTLCRVEDLRLIDFE